MAALTDLLGDESGGDGFRRRVDGRSCRVGRGGVLGLDLGNRNQGAGGGAAVAAAALALAAFDPFGSADRTDAVGHSDLPPASRSI